MLPSQVIIRNSNNNNNLSLNHLTGSERLIAGRRTENNAAWASIAAAQ